MFAAGGTVGPGVARFCSGGGGLTAGLPGEGASVEGESGGVHFNPPALGDKPLSDSTGSRLPPAALARRDHWQPGGGAGPKGGLLCQMRQSRGGRRHQSGGGAAQRLGAGAVARAAAHFLCGPVGAAAAGGGDVGQPGRRSVSGFFSGISLQSAGPRPEQRTDCLSLGHSGVSVHSDGGCSGEMELSPLLTE